jgi:HD superfamily phosphohydrolase YqeK
MIAETEIINTLKATLSHERFIHSISTSKTAASYAKMLKADEEKAYIAGLVHDCAKYLPSSELLRQSELAGIAIDSIQRIAPSLLHGSLGAVYAK